MPVPPNTRGSIRPIPDEALTEQFYAWERRGRGWDVFEYPVALEPPFKPFFGHYTLPNNAPDDARRPSLFGGMIEAFRKRRQPAIEPASSKVEEPEEPEVEPFIYDAPLVEIEIGVPADLRISRERAGQLIGRLAAGRDPVAFELIGLAESVSLQLVCSEVDCSQAYQQIPAYFPEAVLRERQDYLSGTWHAGGQGTVIVDFGLSREFMLPLRVVRDFDVDPFIPLVAALGELSEQEIGVVQIVFERARQPWAESILRAMTDGEGHAFFADAPELLSLGREKISQPLFAAVVRIATRAATHERAWKIARNLGAAVLQFSDPRGNELIPLANDAYPHDDHVEDLLGRVSRRTGMLLNADELVSLVHLPSSSVRSPKLKRIEKKTKGAPNIVFGHSLVVGENHHAGRIARVSLSPAQRVRHTHVIGASGTGKSTLLLNMIAQDIERGEGIAVFDPHGDLIDEILSRIPESRWNDVIVVDPADEEYAIGFNILDAHSDLEKTLLSSDLVGVFRRLSTSWGDQMTSVLGNAILAFLESDRGGTLADLRRFLVDPDYRKPYLRTVRDQEVVYYWEREFPLLSGRPQAPILTRLDTFLRPRLIRHMVSQKVNRLDFASMMNDGKILLAKLTQGAIGEENSYLLGSLLVSKFHQLALARQELRQEERRHFYLYIDEFHNFVTPSLASILSGARKYHIGLVLAHQELRQLGRDADVASAVLSNPCTRICFRVGDADAKKLEDGFSVFDAKDLQSLGVGEAICRVERADYDFNLRTIALAPVPESAAERRQKLVELSRSRYGMRRDAIETRTAAPGEATPGHVSPGPSSATSPAVEKAPEGKRKRETGQPSEASAAGRGGDHHKYLQDLVKRWAEGRGYKVAIEKPILDGLGAVDVAIEKGSRSIACEISVSTDAEHEVGNVQKCLAAGFDEVIVISSEKKVLTAVRQVLAGALEAAQFRRIKFLAPEEAFSFIETLGVQTASAGAASDASEIMTARELEALLRIDVKTIYSYVQKGILPYVKIQSNVRFLRSEVLKWMAERQFKPGDRGTPRKSS